MRLSLIGMMAGGGDRSARHRRSEPVGRTGAGRRSRQPARTACPGRGAIACSRPAATAPGGPVLRRSQQRKPQGADDAARHRRRRSRPDHREPAVPHEDRTGHEERAAGRSVPVAQASRRRHADDGVEGQALDGSIRRPALGAARACGPVGVRGRVGPAGGTGRGGQRTGGGWRQPAHRRRVIRRRAHRRDQGLRSRRGNSTARRARTPASSATTT